MFEGCKSNNTVKKIVGIVMPVFLVVYSFLLVNQGLTVTDTGYNYGNYVNFSSLDGMWKFSTYLASALGFLFTKLPFGETVLGLNFYTGLVKTAIALVVYYFCVYQFDMDNKIVFLAELMALGYCWCPTALLYNYCTYLLFTLGGMLLCLAVKENETKLYVAAGICLGVNVLVRLPNLAEMALICALWFLAVMRKDRWTDTLKRTMLCVLGYVSGIAGVCFIIFCKYGVNEYISGIRQILEMPKEAGGYSLLEMVRGNFLLYLQNLRWVWMALGVCVGGVILYALKKQKFMAGKRVLYVLANVALIWVFHRKYMFDFVYYNYDGIYTVGIFFLIIAGLMGLYIMFFGGENYDLRMQAMVVGIIILISPLGSNNYLFTAENNLFFVTPFVFQVWYRWFKNGPGFAGKRAHFSLEPFKITLLSMIALAFVQGVLFGTRFVFRDGIEGEKRTAQVENNRVLKGMYTNERNAEMLQGLNDFLERENLKGSDVILYQDVPALAFYMDLNPVLSTTWPDLASFSTGKFKEEMLCLQEEVSAGDKRPIIIFGQYPDFEGPKVDILRDFMEQFQYKPVYQNEAFYVYQ